MIPMFPHVSCQIPPFSPRKHHQKIEARLHAAAAVPGTAGTAGTFEETLEELPCWYRNIHTLYIYIHTFVHHYYIITISLLLYIYVHNIYDIFMYMQVYAFFFEDFIETTPSWIYEWYKKDTDTNTHTHMHKLGFDGLQGLNPDLLLAVSGDPSLETTHQSPASNLSGAWRNTWLAIPQGVQRPST